MKQRNPSKNPTVSLVFPAFNEERNIKQALVEFCDAYPFHEVIVVDNNSSDKTAEMSKGHARVILETKQGFGWAVRKGLLEATGDYIILAEPDGTFMGRDVIKLLAYADDFELVLGTRTTRELIWGEANMGWFLRIGNIVVAKFIEVLFSGPSLSDCGCTLRLIRRQSLGKMSPHFTVGGSHFLPEMVVLALKKQLRVIEIPVNYRSRIGDSKITGSKWRAFWVGINMIILTLRYRVFAR